MKTVNQSVLQDLGFYSRAIQGQTIPVHHCYHGFSDGSRAEMLFADESAYKQAMNKLAITVYEWNIILLAFCLMDNHFHFIVYGEQDECESFIREYARRISMSSPSISSKEIRVSVKPLENDIYLKTAICYVLRNPVVARLPYMVGNYPYSSGFLLFAGKECENPWSAPGWKYLLHQNSKDVVRYRELNYREKRGLASSQKTLPDDWMIAEGYVFPGHYVNYELCEKIFGTTRGFNFFMSSCREADFEQSHGVMEILSIPDTEMRSHRDQMIHSMFGTYGVRSLSAQQRGLLARSLRREYRCSAKQIARLVHLDIKQVSDLFV